MNKELILLHLSLIDGIGPITIKKILSENQSGFDLQDLYKLKYADFVALFGFSRSAAEKLVCGLQNKAVVENEFKLIEKHEVYFVTVANENYPKLLANIYAPPAVLYFKGADILCHDKKIAFVGSRKAHRYGERCVEKLIPDLVDNDFVIVSGGAIGADSMAHRTTLRCAGKTVAVLGSGLLKPYPFSNRSMFDEIVQKGGAIVSSFPLMTEARPGNFPSRNRVIAGLSLGCVVIQAAKKSGACITAQYALDEGRDVFAVPGDVDDELSYGCHSLIQQGAKLVGCSEDILIELGLYAAKSYVSSEKKDGGVKSKKYNLQTVEKNVDIGQDNNSVESRILKCCKTPSSTEDIATIANIEIVELHEILFDLQIAGKIKQNHAGMFERV